MKNPAMEKRYRQMKAYHLQRPWRLTDGLFIPHCYIEEESHSWWDEVGFILNKRRILVFWQHPRMSYNYQIKELARQQLPYPAELTQSKILAGKKYYKKVGKSRKKVLSYGMGSLFSDEERLHYQQYSLLVGKMCTEGIDLTIKPSMKIEIHSWCRHVELCVPMEVRNVDEVKALIALTRSLIKRETTLDQVFPDYEYTKQTWLAEDNHQRLQTDLWHQSNSKAKS
jgi:hypothetical protein